MSSHSLMSHASMIYCTACKQIRSFPNQGLIPDVSRENMIFCTACKQSYPNIKGSVRSYVVTEKHMEQLWKRMLNGISKKTSDDEAVKQFPDTHFAKHIHEKGATLACIRPQPQHVSLSCCRMHAANGIPLAKSKGFRTLFERAGVSLCDRAHLSSFKPRIL